MQCRICGSTNCEAHVDSGIGCFTAACKECKHRVVTLNSLEEAVAVFQGQLVCTEFVYE